MKVSILLAAVAFALSTPAADKAPAKAVGAASAFRTSFEASMLAACKRELINSGVPQAEVKFACPCMAKDILANAKTDAELVAHSEALERKAVQRCVALADERFARP